MLKAATLRVLVAATGLALALCATMVADTWDTPWLWVPDVITGFAFFTLSALAWPAHRATAVLALVVGTTWFLGTMFPEVAYWHRGPFIHLLLLFPEARTRHRMLWMVVVVGYVAALLPYAWGAAWSAITLSVCLVAVLVFRARAATGRVRAERRRALAAGCLFAVAVFGAIVAQWLDVGFLLAVPALIGYDLALVLGAVLLATGLRLAAGTHVLDLVIDLDHLPGGTVRDRLAYALGDSSLEIGYWDEASGTYRTPEGDAISTDWPPGTRVLTPIEREGAHFAALLTDASLPDDAVLRDAAQRAALLTAANADLRARTRERTIAAEASQRRIVVAGDDERRRIAARVEAEVGVPLSALAAELDAAATTRADPAALEHPRTIAREVAKLIDRTVSGLSPEELAGGLMPAIAALCARSGARVTWSGSVARTDPAVERALFYACAEVVTNSIKHAEADSIHVMLDDSSGVLAVTVTDDGRGGADESGGGLMGIRDRLGALGGTVTVQSTTATDSQPDAGTRVVLEMTADAILRAPTVHLSQQEDDTPAVPRTAAQQSPL